MFNTQSPSFTNPSPNANPLGNQNFQPNNIPGLDPLNPMGNFGLNTSQTGLGNLNTMNTSLISPSNNININYSQPGLGDLNPSFNTMLSSPLNSLNISQPGLPNLDPSLNTSNNLLNPLGDLNLNASQTGLVNLNSSLNTSNTPLNTLGSLDLNISQTGLVNLNSSLNTSNTPLNTLGSLDLNTSQTGLGGLNTLNRSNTSDLNLSLDLETPISVDNLLPHSVPNSQPVGKYDIFNMPYPTKAPWEYMGIKVPYLPSLDLQKKWYYKLIRSIGDTSYQVVDQWFKVVDADHSGTLEYNEIVNGKYPEKIKIDPTTAKRFMSIFDTSKQGHMSFYDFIGMYRFLELCCCVYKHDQGIGEIIIQKRLEQFGLPMVDLPTCAILNRLFSQGQQIMSLNSWIACSAFVLQTISNYEDMLANGMLSRPHNVDDAKVFLHQSVQLINQ